ncbi:MAG TPA: hypothetical protein EYH32_03015, partial [Anaerolineae bacterium]|nr:hypothetical protein [Anaerolineae bacterium]
MDAHEKPWEQPLEEEYWQALLRDGESVCNAAPPVESDEVWRSLGVELKEETSRNAWEEQSEEVDEAEPDEW